MGSPLRDLVDTAAAALHCQRRYTDLEWRSMHSDWTVTIRAWVTIPDLGLQRCKHILHSSHGLHIGLNQKHQSLFAPSPSRVGRGELL
jgi:hypothetical protein